MGEQLGELYTGDEHAPRPTADLPSGWRRMSILASTKIAMLVQVKSKVKCSQVLTVLT